MELSYMEFQATDARKTSRARPQGLNINILISNANVDGNLLSIEFTYVANYLPNNGYIKMIGSARFLGADAKPAYEEWKKTRKMTGTAGEQIWNTINYGSSINAVYVSRVLNMEPPVAPPTIKLTGSVKPVKASGAVKSVKASKSRK
jgi:hypothetical protein